MREVTDSNSLAICIITEDRLRTVIGEVVREVLKEKDIGTPSVAPSYNKDEYITANEASEMLDVDLSTLWRWSKNGTLIRYHMGPRQIRYKLSDVQAFIENKNHTKTIS